MKRIAKKKDIIERNEEIKEKFWERRNKGESSTLIFWDFEDEFDLKTNTLMDIVYMKGSYS